MNPYDEKSKTNPLGSTIDDIMRDAIACANAGINGLVPSTNTETIYGLPVENHIQLSQQQTIVCNDDIRWLEQQSKPELTMIVGQMTSLMEAIADTKHDTDARIAKLQNQGWFKRMWNTITGKNKATKEEIRHNQDRMVGYISQAVAKLFELGLIEMQAIQSLGNRINHVYAQLTFIQDIQKRTIQLLGRTAIKLNEKIESVDNYFMLRAEIEQGKYYNKSKIYSICAVLSQLDQRTINDERKIEILKVDLQRFNIAPSKSVAIKEFLSEILSLSDEEVGIIYLELGNYKDSFPANIIVETIEEYHFLSLLEKKAKNKKAIIDSILDNHNIEGNTALAYSDIFENFIENRVNSTVSLDELRITSVPSTHNESFSSSLRQEEASFPIHEESSLYLKEIQENVLSDDEFVNYSKIINEIYGSEMIQSEPFIGIKILCKNSESLYNIGVRDISLCFPDSITGMPPLSGTGCFLRDNRAPIWSDDITRYGDIWLITMPVPRSLLEVQIQKLIRAAKFLKQNNTSQLGYIEINVSGRCPVKCDEMCLNNLMIPDNYMVFADKNDDYPYKFGKVERIDNNYICFRSRWKFNPNDPNLYQNISTIALLISAMYR